MAKSDPAAQGSRWYDWPVLMRDADSEMNEDFWAQWGGRQQSLRTRPCPGDELSITSAALGSAGVWTDQTPGSRLYLPPWAERLVMCVQFTITLGSPEPLTLYEGKVRARFGAPGGYAYSAEPGVKLGNEIFFKPGPPGGDPIEGFGDVLPDCDGGAAGNGSGNGKRFIKRMLFDVPSGMRDTEQAFIYQVLRTNLVVTGAKIENALSTSYPHLGWYFIALEAA